MKWFGNNYGNYRIIKNNKINNKGEVINVNYCIQYRYYWLGIPFWRYYKVTISGWGGGTYYIARLKDSNLLESEYNDWVKGQEAKVKLSKTEIIKVVNDGK